MEQSFDRIVFAYLYLQHDGICQLEHLVKVLHYLLYQFVLMNCRKILIKSVQKKSI